MVEEKKEEEGEFNKYKNGKIYKIFSDQTDKIYIGSTCNSLDIRYSVHHSDYMRFLNGKGKKNYCSSFKLLDFRHDIKLICNYPCNNWDELRKEEQRHMDINSDYIVNDARAYRKVRLKKEKIIKNGQYKCECGTVLRIDGKNRHIRSKKHEYFILNSIFINGLK